MQLLKPGASFGAGRYEVVRMIRAGGMGVVYEVLHKDTRRKRALKIMLPQVALDGDLRARFTREGIVTAGIDSEHLVEVFDIGVDEETQAPFLVMELLRGEDLGARLDRGERTSPAELLEIFEQVARALDKTHAAGVVHRDLKPENLFVTRRDDGSLRMRILDFGIAKLMEGTGAKKSTRSVGTPLYMSPEQMTGEATDLGPPADVYALGHIAFTLLVGVAYFEPEARTTASALGLMSKVCSGAVEPASRRAEIAGVPLPPGFDAWFAQATALKPASRFASAGELVAALREVLAEPPAPSARAAAAAAAKPVAFAATIPLVGASPAASSLGAVAHADSFAEPEPELRASQIETGPVPSSRTVPTPSRAGSRARLVALVAGALAVVATAAFVLTRAPNGATEQRAGAESAASAGPAPVGPGVTLVATSGQVPGGPAGALAPASAPPTISAAASGSSAASASARASGSSAPPPARAPGPVPKAPPPGAVPTVWDGPRR